MKSNDCCRASDLRLLAIFCILVTIPVPGLLAQTTQTPASSFTFPHFIRYQDVSTGIAIFNPSQKEASVVLTLTGWNGGSLGDPAIIKVPARGQVAKTAVELFPLLEIIDASLVISSATPGILAFYQTFDEGGTFLDGAGSTEAGSTLVFPVVPGPNEGDSELDFLNPNIRPAAADLKLWSYNGDLLGTATIQVPAGGFYRTIARDAFPSGTSFTNASHVTATSKPVNVFSQAQSIAGTSLFWGFSSVTVPGGYVDVAALNAAPLSRLATSGVLPHFRTGSQYASILALVNAEPAAVDVDLTAVGNNGSILGTRRINLKANGGSRALLQSVFSSLVSGEKEGWILLRSTGRVYAAMIHGRSDAESLTAIPLQTSPVTEILAPQVLQGSGFYTELTLVNPGATTGITDIFLAKEDGETRGSVTVYLGPGARISQPLDQIFPYVVSQSGGYIYTRSTQPLFGTATIGSDNGALNTNVACQAMTAAFTPAPQKYFIISGKVTLDDKPAPDFHIVLTGPVSGDTTSAADGTYYFKALTAGKYSIKIEYPPTLEFAPSDTAFEITTASRRQDFQGFTKPSVWGIVTMNDRTAAGFKVTLSGPVSLSAVSAADGSYLFKSLPGGNYSLIIEYQTGFQFVPSYLNFDLARLSRRQDFVGSTEPNGIVIAPPTSTVSGIDALLTIYGRDFNDTAQVMVDLIRLKTTYIDQTLLRAVLPAYMLAHPSRFDIAVTTNPGKSDQRTTKPFSYLVYQANPTLTSVSAPELIVEAGPGVTLTLKGSGFLKDTKVKINGSSEDILSAVLDSSTIMADVPARYFARGGVYPVVVQNSYPAMVESNIQLLSVFYGAPAVQSVLPGAVPARLELSAEPLNIEVLGYGFRRGAVVLCNGEPLATTYCENNAYCLTVHLYAKVPPSMMRNSGFAEITVHNPEPSLAASEAVFMRIDGLQPTITSVAPGAATALNLPGQFSVPVVINGTNFGPQTSLRVYFTGGALPAFSVPILLSSTQLYANVLVDYASLGQWNAEAMNPQPGGGMSQPMAFLISAGTLVANPFLIVLAPPIVAVGSPGFTLTITGTNFKNGAQVQFRSTLLRATVVSDRVISAEVPASLLLSAGRVPISVINPDNGGTSNRLYLDIQ